MAAIVTSKMRTYAAKQFLSGFSDPTEHLYLYVGRTLPWFNDNLPDTPVDCENDNSSIFREMIALKLINSSDVSLVAPRNSWVLGTIYTPYSNYVDLFDPSSNLPPFYVVSDTLNVYKCINNNNGAPSTVQPTGTTNTVVTSADFYQWKYMFTINSADVLNFVTTEWIPVRTLTTNDGSLQWQVQQAAVPGTIDRIDMQYIGTQYTQIPTVTIAGDGTGATAVATISGGNVTGITVTSTGSNYTWATVSITNGGVASNGAVATAIISPFGGHGSDPIAELGAYYVLLDQKLTYDENRVFTVSNDYRRIGILQNPLLNDGVTPAVAATFDQSTRLTFGTVSGSVFNADEVVTGSTSGATGVVLDYGAFSTLTLRLVQVKGTFVPGETVVGAAATGVLQTITGTVSSATSSTVVLPNTASSANDAYKGQTILITAGVGIGQTAVITGYSGISRTATVTPNWTTNPTSSSVFKIANIVKPDLAKFSGDVVYVENRRPIMRASDQVEDIKIVVEF